MCEINEDIVYGKFKKLEMVDGFIVKFAVEKKGR